jgi:hypothetical protein
MTDLKQFEGHTPGPWEQTIYEHGGSRIFAGERILIADTYEPVANAALILSAPALLAEVKELRERADKLAEALQGYMEKFGPGYSASFSQVHESAAAILAAHRKEV